MVAIDGAHHAGPSVEDDEIARRLAFENVAVGIDDGRLHAEEGQRRGAGLELGGARQRRDENAAGLRLPPRVDDRTALLADHVVVPLPRFRVDRLAHGAEQPERFPARVLHMLVARAHQRADRRRRGVEDVDLVLVDHLPEARGVRIVRHALEHQRDRAVGERPVDDIAVARDPADIRGAPVDVAVVIIEDVLMRHRRVDEIAARRVQHALGLSRRARRVENEQRVLRVHLLRRTFRLGALAIASSSHTSRPSVHGTSPPVWRTTSTVLTCPFF